MLATNVDLARRARALIELVIEPLPPVLDPREAAALGHHITPPRTFACGDLDAAWADCAHIVSGRADSGGQEHFYLETQAALAVPTEDGTLQVHSATQAPDRGAEGHRPGAGRAHARGRGGRAPAGRRLRRQGGAGHALGGVCARWAPT